MEINLGENNVAINRQSNAFDNLLGVVAGNDFFDKEALKKVQTEELQDAFYDWASEEFLGEDEEGESKSIAGEIVKGFEEYRESWEKFNAKEFEKDKIKTQIEKLEKTKIYELSLSDAVENKKKIAALKAQLEQL